MDVTIPINLTANSFSRATVGTYYDSTGLLASAAINTVRINYDPLNLSAPPLPLIESASTNYAYFENFLWQGYSVQTSANTTTDWNSAIAPDGRYSADKLVETIGSASHSVGLFTGAPALSTGTWTYSVHVKAAERNVIDLLSASDAWRFDLVAGTVTGVGTPVATTALIKNVGNGWYRCSITGEISTELLTPSLRMVSAGNVTYTGDGVSGVYLWGGQGEAGSVATSPIYSPIVFTSRASTASYVNSSGFITSAAANVARQNYNPDNLVISPRLLVESAATNLCLQSEVFGTTWVATNATLTANSTTSPANTLTADTITDAAAGNHGNVSQNVTIPNNSAGYVFSVFIKKTVGAASFPAIWIRMTGGGTNRPSACTINTDTGVATASSTLTTPPAYMKVDSHKDYWRCSIGVYNNNTGNVTAELTLYPAVNTDGSGVWNFATTGSAIFWGAQLETQNAGFTAPFTTQSLTRTSYIATTTTAVTRAADVFTYDGSELRAADIATPGLLYTNIPENDFPVWNSGTAYAIETGTGANSVIYKHVKYSSLQASNTNHQPDISPTWWSVIGATNAYAMVDTQVGTQTVASVGGHVIAAILIGGVTSLNFINVSADTITVKIYSNGVVVYTNVIDFTGGSSGVPITDYSLTGLTAYADAIAQIDVYAASPRAAAIGNFVVGTKYYVGSTETNPTVGITDYSIKTVDAFGNPVLTKRGYAKRMNTKQMVDDSQVDFVARLMAQVRATPCVWNANTTTNYPNANTKTSLIIYGYYKDWEIDCSYTKSWMTATIEGLL